MDSQLGSRSCLWSICRRELQDAESMLQQGLNSAAEITIFEKALNKNPAECLLSCVNLHFCELYRGQPLKFNLEWKKPKKIKAQAASRFELNHRSSFSGMANFAEHIKRLFIWFYSFYSNVTVYFAGFVQWK